MARLPAAEKPKTLNLGKENKIGTSPWIGQNIIFTPWTTSNRLALARFSINHENAFIILTKPLFHSRSMGRKMSRTPVKYRGLIVTDRPYIYPQPFETASYNVIADF